MTVGQLIAVPEELVSTRCSNCGYSLEGIAPDIVCPECGREQRPEEIVLYGWARGKHELTSNARPSRIAWAFLGSNLWFVFYGYISGGWAGRAMMLLSLSPLLGLLVNRRESLLDGKIQVRLTSTGCVQYDSTGPRSWLRELITGYRWMVMLLVAATLAVWVIRSQTIDATVWGAIGIVASAIFAGSGWRESRPLHAAKRLLADDAIIDANAVYYKVTPWRLVGGFTLEPLVPGRYRLKVEELYRYRVSTGAKLVDAEIELPDDHADALRTLIDVWMTHLNRKVEAVPA